MDDQLHDGRSIGALRIVDQHTRKAMPKEVLGLFHSINLIEVPNRLSRPHRKPSAIQVDNGPEFFLATWIREPTARRRALTIVDHPTVNAFIDAFITSIRA